MINETYKFNIKGNVVTSWTDGYVFKPISSTHNEIMYATADCLAQMYAGQPRKIPAKIGFMFTQKNDVPTVPTSKSTTWNDLVNMCGTDFDTDIQVVDFSFSPSLTNKNAAGTENYVSNVAVFHGHSDVSLPGEVCGLDIRSIGTKIFGAILLSEDKTPLSIVALSDGSTPYLERPDGFELALDWYITFSVDSSPDPDPPTPVVPSETTFHFSGSTDETYLIEGTLDQAKMVELGFYDEEYNWIKQPMSVEIGSGVTRIGDNAFISCGSLSSVTIPNSVTSIKGGAFADCNNLASVTIGNSVTSIEDGAFINCRSLTSITIPDSVMSIGGGMVLYNCSSLTSVTMSGKTKATVQGMDSYPWGIPSGCVIHCTDGDITVE